MYPWSSAGTVPRIYPIHSTFTVPDWQSVRACSAGLYGLRLLLVVRRTVAQALAACGSCLFGKRPWHRALTLKIKNNKNQNQGPQAVKACATPASQICCVFLCLRLVVQSGGAELVLQPPHKPAKWLRNQCCAGNRKWNRNKPDRGWHHSDHREEPRSPSPAGHV